MLDFAKRHKNTLFEIVVLLAFMIPLAFSYRDYITGDPSIYFTFFKNFFAKPFSYYPEHVSYGASSPIFVVIGAFCHLIFSNSWFIMLKVFSFCICGAALFFANRTIKGSIITLLPIISVFHSNQAVLPNTGMLFEVPLVLLALSLLIFFSSTKKEKHALIVNGLLYLVRPEMAVLSIIMLVFLFLRSNEKKTFVLWAFISYLPSILYVFYMYINTGDLLPSSAVGRYIYAIESGTGRWQSIHLMFTNWWSNNSSVTYLCILSGVLFVVMNKKPPIVLLLSAVGIFLPFLIFPTQPGYFIRYSLPFIIVSGIAAGYISNILIQKVAIFVKNSTVVYVVSLFVMACVLLFSIIHNQAYRNVKSDTLDNTLCTDLGQSLNQIIDKDDIILIYEIQAQYSLVARCISLDAIVGSEMTDFLMKRQSFEDALAEYNVKYIVTMNSLNYRQIFLGTPLVDLYMHDLQSELGDTLMLNGLCYEKILTNPMFSDERLFYLVESSQIYNDGTNTLRRPNTDVIGGVPNMWWNSVYRVTLL